METQSSTVAWPWSRRLIWVGFLILAGWLYGAGFCRALFVPGNNLADFFQEWASARNYFAGLPIYSPQRETARRYLDFAPEPDAFFIEINAHPPTSVLLSLPLGLLSYRTAFLVWNWLSVAALAASVWLVITF